MTKYVLLGPGSEIEPGDQIQISRGVWTTLKKSDIDSFPDDMKQPLRINDEYAIIRRMKK